MSTRRCNAEPPSRGFTLVELVIAVLILAILVSLALPSFQSTIRSNRLSASTNQLVSAISLARSEAIKNTSGAGVCSSSDGASCAGVADWSVGWLVWADRPDAGTGVGNGVFNAGTDVVLRYSQGPAQMRIAGPAAVNDVRFDRRGRLAGAADLQFQLRPDTCGDQLLLRPLTLTRVGQIRKGALASCP